MLHAVMFGLSKVLGQFMLIPCSNSDNSTYVVVLRVSAVCTARDGSPSATYIVESILRFTGILFSCPVLAHNVIPH